MQAGFAIRSDTNHYEKTQYIPITKTYAIYGDFVQRVKNKNRNYLKFFIFFLFFLKT